MIFTHDWFSGNIPVWEAHLSHLKGRPNLRALEIGCYEGRATVWLLENVLTDSTSTITAIDTFEGADEHRELKIDFSGVLDRFLKNTSQFSRQVRLRKTTSFEALRKLIGPYDIAYIDGSHRALDVLTDLCLVWHLMAKGGTIILDDYEWDRYPDPFLNPRLGIDAFLSVVASEIDVRHKAYQIILVKK